MSCVEYLQQLGSLLKDGYSGFSILATSLLLAFVYMFLDLVRCYLIARSKQLI